MKMNIKKYVQRLQHVNLMDVIVEAVANSLHAKATHIDIACSYTQQPDNLYYIKSISIADNGEGFHKLNQTSFDTFMTDYKQKLGCRGVGRFSFLKVFNLVRYESSYKSNGVFEQVKFTFNNSFESGDYIITSNYGVSTYTKLFLDNIHKKYESKKQSAKTPSEIKRYLVEKLLIEFSLSNTFTISIHGNDHQEVLIQKHEIPVFEEETLVISQDPIQPALNPAPIQKEFNVQYYFKNGIDIAAYFCTERRTVKRIEAKITLPEGIGGIFLVSSSFLDKYVNDLRTNYDIPKDNIFSPELINNEIKKKLASIIISKFPSIMDSNKEITDNVKSKYPYLKRYISVDDYVGVVDAKDVINKALKSQRAVKEQNIREYELLQSRYYTMLESHKVDKDLLYKFSNHIDATSELNKENLVEFVWYSDTIINFMTELIETRLTDEATIHNLIIKKNEIHEQSPDIVPAKQNNMWIFGHQFMGYKYVASDKKIEDILKSLNQEMVYEVFTRRKPDIFMVMPKEDISEVSDIVIFELKKPDATFFDKVKGISQIETYVDALRKNIHTMSMSWGYLLITFDQEIEERLKAEQYTKTFTENGIAYTKYNDPRKLLLTVLDIKGLLSMAKNRNKVFTDILEDNTREN